MEPDCRGDHEKRIQMKQEEVKAYSYKNYRKGVSQVGYMSTEIIIAIWSTSKEDVDNSGGGQISSLVLA